VVVLGSVFLMMYGRGLLESASRWQTERACRNYTAPSTQVVYEEEPVAAAALLSNADGYFTAPALGSRGAPATVHVPSCWNEFTFADVNGRPRQPLLLLHELHSKSAVPLVSVELIDLPRPQRLLLWVSIYNRDRPDNPWRGIRCAFPLKLTPSEHLRFYAGQVDSADPGHFTIRYAIDGKDGLIQGRLSDGGDYINFGFPDMLK